jgi:hypothetical protein
MPLRLRPQAYIHGQHVIGFLAVTTVQTRRLTGGGGDVLTSGGSFIMSYSRSTCKKEVDIVCAFRSSYGEE